MFCQECGNQLVEGAKFCQKCGAKVVHTDTEQQMPDMSVQRDKTQSVASGSKAVSGSKVVSDSRTITDSSAIPYEKRGGDNIKPYYREQFERIASGQKARFNWAAFFLGGWMQLYNGCTGIFCKTFLPLLLVSFVVSLVSILGALRFNLVLMGITPFLSMVLGFCSIALAIINGLKFNEWYYQDVTNNPDKQRSRKGLWILLVSEAAAIVLLFLLPVIFRPSYDDFADSLSEEELSDAQAGSGNINLSEIYINETEGFSFKYPSAWQTVEPSDLGEYYDESDMENVIVLLANKDERVSASYNSYIEVLKFPYSPGIDDLLTSSEEHFRENFSATDEITGFADMELDGVPVRAVTYVTPEDVYYRSYFYNIGFFLYRVNFFRMGEATQNLDSFFDAVLDSYTITAASEEGKTESSDEGKAPEYEAAYAEKVRELAAEDDTLLFSLIELTGGDVPALAVDSPGYGVSVFMWADGEIITLMDWWPYGAMGNMGYEYLPGRNVIRNFNSDYAGAVIYEFYMTVNNDYEIVDFNDGLCISYFKDANRNGMPDEGEYSEEPVYYYGDMEISEEEYTAHQIQGDYEWITGDKSAAEMLSQLNGAPDFDKFLYKDIPVNQIFELSIDDVVEVFGTPLDLYEDACYYNDIAFYFSADTGEMTALETAWDLSLFTMDGQTLNKDREGLMEIFGVPSEEGEDKSYEYYMMYFFPEYLISIDLGEAESEAWKIYISRG